MANFPQKQFKGKHPEAHRGDGVIEWTKRLSCPARREACGLEYPSRRLANPVFNQLDKSRIMGSQPDYTDVQ